MTTPPATSPAAAPKPSRWPRRLKILAVLILLATLTLAIGVNTPLARHQLAQAMIWVTNTNRPLNLANDLKPDALRDLGIDRQLRVDTGPPAASIQAWIIEPTSLGSPGSSGSPGPAAAAAPHLHPRARGTLLILHGINSDKRAELGPAHRFAALGYRTVLVDLRAHGWSSGQWESFGVHESRDLQQLLDALTAQGLIQGPIGVWAPSLGGAVAIQLAGLDPRIKAVVSLDAFASLRGIAPRDINRYLPVVGWFITQNTVQQSLNEAGRLADFDPDDASPERAITRTTAAVLLIHGLADRNIPYTDALRLHAAAPDHSDLMLVPGAGHNDIAGPRTFELVFQRSADWFAKYLTP